MNHHFNLNTPYVNLYFNPRTPTKTFFWTFWTSCKIAPFFMRTSQISPQGPTCHIVLSLWGIWSSQRAAILHVYTHTPLSHHFTVCLLTLALSFFSPFSCQLKALKRQLVKNLFISSTSLFSPLILSPYHSSVLCHSEAWKVTRVTVCNFIIKCGEF